MTDKVQKNQIADILMDFYDEYDSNVINRPMIPNIYAGKILDSLQEYPVEKPVSRTPADIEAAMAELEEKTKTFAEAHKGKSADELLAEMRGEEPVNEELEEASLEYFKQALKDGDKTKLDAFKAGAKWQKKQDQETIELAEDHAMLAGMEKMKERMMAKAIDATIEEPEPLLWRVLGELEGLFVAENNLHDGDGVKVIII